MITAAQDSTVRIEFSTDRTTGPASPSTALLPADFKIYKDGSQTPKTTANGVTVVTDFGSIPGLHLLEIDTSNDTGDAGFWAVGSSYTVAINSAATIGGNAIVAWIGQFRLVTNDVLAGPTPLTGPETETIVDTLISDYDLDTAVPLINTLENKTQADARQVALLAQHTATQTSVSTTIKTGVAYSMDVDTPTTVGSVEKAPVTFNLPS